MHQDFDRFRRELKILENAHKQMQKLHAQDLVAMQQLMEARENEIAQADQQAKVDRDSAKDTAVKIVKDLTNQVMKEATPKVDQAKMLQQMMMMVQVGWFNRVTLHLDLRPGLAQTYTLLVGMPFAYQDSIIACGSSSRLA
jgi:hypothetical protein